MYGVTVIRVKGVLYLTNFVYTVYKDKSTNKVVGVFARINGIDNYYSIDFVVSNKVRFSNAVVCSNGTIRGVNCNLKFEYKRNIIKVYHGSQEQYFKPIYGLGEDKHDYGKGFYLTQNVELAREWAVSSQQDFGYLHTYSLDITDLSVFDFNKESPLVWLAELMSHRDADSSIRYKRLSKKFIEIYKKDISKYDVVYGWRADSSYFSIAKRFVRNEIDYDLIPILFHLGELENQICLKSKKSFNNLTEVCEPEIVSSNYGLRYSERDKRARRLMNEVINSDRNTMQRGFDYVLRRKIDV